MTTLPAVRTDEYAQRLTFVLNTAQYGVHNETLSYLVHG